MLRPGKVAFKVSFREALPDGKYEIVEASRQWEVVQSIGEGAMSVVYRAEWVPPSAEDSFVSNVTGHHSAANPLDRPACPVAIKVCKRFDDEATPAELTSGPDALTNYRRIWDDTCYRQTWAEETVADKCRGLHILRVYEVGWVELDDGEPRPALLMQLADGTLEDLVPPCGLPPPSAPTHWPSSLGWASTAPTARISSTVT
jgi:serine/threonine protein kinase